MKIETTILRHLVKNENYMRKSIPFLKTEYFLDPAERILFEEIYAFVKKYKALPSFEALVITIDEKQNIPEGVHKKIHEIIKSINVPSEQTDEEWLVDTTEKFCQDRAIHNAIMNSISALDGTHKTFTKDSIPSLLKDALAVSFDTHVGHDFLEEVALRYDYYHKVEYKIPFDLDYMNRITRGGFSKKTLNIFLGGTGGGKTLTMCHMAANNLMDGKNVLYITMEMAEEKIAERIDANLLGIEIADLEVITKDMYESKINALKKKTTGKLIIKEYPTASAHAGHFRHLLNELRLKKNFVPDIIYVDYINICLSSRYKPGTVTNSYFYIKSIAEELRGLAVEFNLPLVSATQTTRSGFANSDPDLTDTSESFGLPATADFMMAIIATEDMQKLNQMMFKQLKNRYNDPNVHKRFIVGVDRPKMKLYDVDDQGLIEEDVEVPAMDKTAFGKRQKEDDTMKWATKTMGRKDFSGLKHG